MQSEEQLSPFDVPLEIVVLPPELLHCSTRSYCMMTESKIKGIPASPNNVDA